MGNSTKANRLILWQRVTIAALLLSLVAVGVHARMSAGSAAWWENEANHRSRLIWDKCEESDTKEAIIRDLDDRLRKYEVRFGEIQPVREGEGIYIDKKIGSNIGSGFLCRLPLKR